MPRNKYKTFMLNGKDRRILQGSPGILRLFYHDGYKLPALLWLLLRRYSCYPLSSNLLVRAKETGQRKEDSTALAIGSPEEEKSVYGLHVAGG
jgi:hypothetical protein